MSESPQMSFAFPRPGPALKAVLVTLAVLGLLGAAVMAWIPGGATAIAALVCTSHGVLPGQVWRLGTSGVVMLPGEGAISHLMMTLIGRYFLSPDLDRRWGAASRGGYLSPGADGGPGPGNRGHRHRVGARERRGDRPALLRHPGQGQA